MMAIGVESDRFHVDSGGADPLLLAELIKYIILHSPRKFIH